MAKEQEEDATQKKEKQSKLLEEFQKTIKGETLRFSHQLKRTKKKDNSTS